MRRYNWRGELTDEALLAVCRAGYCAWERSIRRRGGSAVLDFKPVRLDSAKRTEARMRRENT